MPLGLLEPGDELLERRAEVGHRTSDERKKRAAGSPGGAERRIERAPELVTTS